MSGRRILFVDRDGTLVEEPPDEQVDDLSKIRLMPDVIPALLKLKEAGYEFAMVTNQDGLGTESFPAGAFETSQRFILDLFSSQGIAFDHVFICPHFKSDGCDCRKPKPGMLNGFLAATELDKPRCFVIGDRDTDLEFARNIGIQGMRISKAGGPDQTWHAVAARIASIGRSAHVHRRTKETDISLSVDLSQPGGTRISTGIGFFDHMLEQVSKHAGFSLQVAVTGDLDVDEHHTVEDCALALGAALREALGDKRGIGRYGFLLAMDEAQAQVAIDLSGRPYFVWEGRFNRDMVGELPTELVPHFFRSFAETLGAALHIQVRGENTHHMIESCFKGVGRTLRQAIRLEGGDLPSTKGVL